MTQEIILTKSEKKLKSHVTFEGAESTLRKLGWLIALFPVLSVLIWCVQIMFAPTEFVFGFFALNVSCALILMYLVLTSVKYMRVFFGANLAQNAWGIGSLFFSPISCLYLFVCRKNIKNNKNLRKTMHAQIITSVIGWGIDAFIAIPVALIIAFANASVAQHRSVVNDEIAQIVTDVRTLYAEYDDFSGLGNKQIKSSVGNISYVVSTDWSNPHQFVVSIAGLSEKDCLHFATKEWKDSVGYKATSGQGGGATAGCELGDGQNFVNIKYGE